MKLLVLKQILVGVALLSTAYVAQATTSTYTDFDTWSDDIAGTITTDTFNAYDFGTTSKLFGNSVTLGGNTFSIASGNLFGVTKDLDYDATYLKSNYLEWEFSNPNSLTITLSGNTQAFGLKFGQFYGDVENFDITLGNGDSFSVSSNDHYSFFGAISTKAFNSLTISSAQFPVIDNLSTGPVTAVPEPETYGMMLMGLGLMGFIVRRRKDQQA